MMTTSHSRMLIREFLHHKCRGNLNRLLQFPDLLLLFFELRHLHQKCRPQRGRFSVRQGFGRASQQGRDVRIVRSCLRSGRG